MKARAHLHALSLTLALKTGAMFRYAWLGITALVLGGCGKGPQTGGIYSAQCTPLQIVPGRSQSVELATYYLLPSNPKTATTVSYHAQVTTPPGWSVSGNSWEFACKIKTNEIGFNEKRKIQVAVPVDATPGQHLLKLSIPPALGPPQAVDLRLVVVNQSK